MITRAVDHRYYKKMSKLDFINRATLNIRIRYEGNTEGSIN